MIPRRVKTNPYLLFSWQMLIWSGFPRRRINRDRFGTHRMAAGSVIVMPTPTAEPCIAAIVGFWHRWMAMATRPPLRSNSQSPFTKHASSKVGSACVRVPIILGVLAGPISKSHVEVGSGTESLPGTSQNHHLDAFV